MEYNDCIHRLVHKIAHINPLDSNTMVLLNRIEIFMRIVFSVRCLYSTALQLTRGATTVTTTTTTKRSAIDGEKHTHNTICPAIAASVVVRRLRHR